MRKLHSKYITILFVLFLLLFAFLLRTFGIDWDQGMHFHPDERAIVMAVIPLQFPTSLTQFFSTTSPWNPHFFAYGSFPMYLLKLLSLIASFINPAIATYEQINLLGRFISALFDTTTVLIVFLLAKKLWQKKVAVLAAVFYTLSVLPIQLSHFYAVDTLLTFFITFTLYLLVCYYEQPSVKLSLLIGLTTGLGLATKDSALVLGSAILVALSVDFFLLVIKTPHKIRIYKHAFKNMVNTLFTHGILMALLTCFVFIICEPYAIIDFSEFSNQTAAQATMTHNAFVFPYTLQYVGIIPYWYELKNIFFWGMGPLLATICFLGVLYGLYNVWLKEKKEKWAGELIILVFFLMYFGIVGKFAIGFMRYMLPIYPLLCLFGGMFTFRLLEHIKQREIKLITWCVLLVALLIWPLSFLSIYTKPNTRNQADTWIYKNILPGKTLATEHWDDQLPAGDGQTYKNVTLTLYDPDSPEKWQSINTKLSQADYIILASNRLYVPLVKLTNCQKLYPHPCYEQTAKYYQKLFSNKLGFTKVAEFTDYPIVPFLNLQINDQSADESFTVYDHPKIMIFKKI